MLVIALAAAMGGGFGCQSGSQAGATASPSAFSNGAGSSDVHAASPKGRVVAAPASITAFAPRSDAVVVDAYTVNYRQLFEDLGPDATLWYQHVHSLANPFFEGRLPGTRGSALTAEYIEFYFRSYGLEPVFADDATDAPGGEAGVATSYLQPFDFTPRGPSSLPGVSDANAAIGSTPLEQDEDFVVLGNSGSGQVSGPVTFVGYGIAQGPDGYTSFDEDTDLTGRIALLLRYEPLDEDGYSQWAEARFSPRAAIAPKMREVASRGAAGIMLVAPPDVAEGRKALESLRASVRFGRGLDIPVIQITMAVADALLAEADPDGADLMAWRRRADLGEVTTADLDDDVHVSFGAEVDRLRVDVQNVAGILPGRGFVSDEWIVVCAHHDHVGMGDLGGINPRNRGQLHPGADDNASGTAGVLVLAKMLSQAYAEAPDDAELRSVLFVTFDAEELGLIGSRYFTNHPPIPLEQVTLAMNMDMIGRLRAGNLSVLGTATAQGLPELLRPHFEASGLTVAVNESGSGRSDDANFHRVEVPAIHFFTGMHPEYTSPRDHAYTVNPAGAGLILDLMYAIALDVADDAHQLVFQEPPPSRGQDRGYGRVRLGIQPGMGDDVESGVLIDRVFDGTSAAEGGLVAGDILVGWNEHEIDSLRDLFERLQEHKPGDKVTLSVFRNEQRIELEVTLKASRRQ